MASKSHETAIKEQEFEGGKRALTRRRSSTKWARARFGVLSRLTDDHRRGRQVVVISQSAKLTVALFKAGFISKNTDRERRFRVPPSGKRFFSVTSHELERVAVVANNRTCQARSHLIWGCPTPRPFPSSFCLAKRWPVRNVTSHNPRSSRKMS